MGLKRTIARQKTRRYCYQICLVKQRQYAYLCQLLVQIQAFLEVANGTFNTILFQRYGTGESNKNIEKCTQELANLKECPSGADAKTTFHYHFYVIKLVKSFHKYFFTTFWCKNVLEYVLIKKRDLISSMCIKFFKSIFILNCIISYRIRST